MKWWNPTPSFSIVRTETTLDDKLYNTPEIAPYEVGSFKVPECEFEFIPSNTALSHAIEAILKRRHCFPLENK